jgi:hypothetical protein
MSELKAQASLDVKRSDLQSIFQKMQDEISRSMSIAQQTTTVADTLKPMIIDPTKGTDEKVDRGIVASFWNELNRLQGVNDLAQRNLNHLAEVVGS